MNSMVGWQNSHKKCVYSMKVMSIGKQLIHTVCVHTECTFTGIYIECAFSQSTSIGDLKPV